MTAEEWMVKGDAAAQAGDERDAQACYRKAAEILARSDEWDAAVGAGLRVVDSLLRESATKGGLAWAAGETLRHIEDQSRPWQRGRVAAASHTALLAKRDQVEAAQQAWHERYAANPPAMSVDELRAMSDAVGGAIMAGYPIAVDLNLTGRRATTVVAEAD